MVVYEWAKKMVCSFHNQIPFLILRELSGRQLFYFELSEQIR